MVQLQAEAAAAAAKAAETVKAAEAAAAPVAAVPAVLGHAAILAAHEPVCVLELTLVARVLLCI